MRETEYYIGQPVVVGNAYRMGAVSGQGRFVADEVTGRYLVVEICRRDLGLIRETWETRALDVEDLETEVYVHRSRILGDRRCTALPTADGSARDNIPF